MSTPFSTIADPTGLAGGPGSPARVSELREWLTRLLDRIGHSFEAVSGVFMEQASAGTKSGESSLSPVVPYPARFPGDVLAGQPAVVIPLNRAVVCGEDHVYDVGQFSVCPNCAAEERLSLGDLLAHGRRAPLPLARDLAPRRAGVSARRGLRPPA